EHVELDDVHLLFFGPDQIPDASVNLGRKSSEYDISQFSKLKRKHKKALTDYKPTNQLRFIWKRLL
ncbi:hypothetical protein LCGC14_3092390, partial [marine sediment metagenome]